MAKRYKLTVEDTETGEKHTNEVDIYLSSGIVIGEDGINRSVCTHIVGDYVSLCRAYTMLGAVINNQFITSKETEKKE